MSLLAWGGIALVAAFLFFWLGILPKTQVILAFIGTCIVTGGLFGSLLTRAADLVSNLLGTLTGKVFGVAIPGLLVIVLLIIFIHDLLPKKSAGKRTFWVGIALAACLVAGLSSFTALNQVPANVRTGVSTTTGGSPWKSCCSSSSSTPGNAPGMTPGRRGGSPARRTPRAPRSASRA